MTAANILQSALGHMQDRAATYDKPSGERSMGATVDAFKAVTGVLMTEEQGWLFMALLKAVRSQQGAYSADSYEDGAAYFALAGESACIDRNGGWTPDAIKSAALHPDFGQQNMINPADVDISDDAGGKWYSKDELIAAINAASVEPASLIDDESPRADAIGQNGNTGEHYDDPWAGAPEWAKYKAQDEDGEWFWFELVPRRTKTHVWISEAGGLELASYGEPSPDWRTTLISR